MRKLVTGYCHETNKEMKARHKKNAELGIKGRYSEQREAPKYCYVAITGEGRYGKGAKRQGTTR